jgi:hypothetical protein
VLQTWRCEVWSRPRRTGSWMPPSACMSCARRRRCSSTAISNYSMQRFTSSCLSLSQHRRSCRSQGLTGSLCNTSCGVARLLNLQSTYAASQALDVDEDACLLVNELLPVGSAATDARLRLHVTIKTEVWQALPSVIALSLVLCVLRSLPGPAAGQ